MSGSTADELMTPAEVAKQFGVSPVTVRTWVNKGWLKSTLTPGGHRRFSKDDVEQLLSERNKRHSGESPMVRILVVDDETAFRKFMVEAIESLLSDCEILEAADGFQAGLAVEKYHPELVFLDYAMPGMNGADVCRFIKKEEGYTATKIIAITGHADDFIKRSLLDAGADDVLYKPISIDTIQTTLAQFQVLKSA